MFRTQGRNNEISFYWMFLCKLLTYGNASGVNIATSDRRTWTSKVDILKMQPFGVASAQR
jgi:hypothetical protein